jgi:hypothetical protein
LDRGLAHHGIELDGKHYGPLLHFLGGAPYIFQQMFAPNIVMGGPERNGGYPINFVHQTQGCQGWLHLSDDHAHNIIEHIPFLLDVAYFRGRPTEAELDATRLPEDTTGLRRNELGYLVRERAQHFNSVHELARRQSIQKAQEDAIKKKLADDAQATADKVKKADDQAKKKLARVADAERKKIEMTARSIRVNFKKDLQSKEAYCYCAKPDVGKYLRCGGENKCHLRKWVHATCAKKNGDVVTNGMIRGDENEIFWCHTCQELYGVSSSAAEVPK